MVPNEEKEGGEAKSEGQWHYLAVKNIYALLRRIISKYKSNFDWLNCLHSFLTQRKNLNLRKKYFKIKVSVGLHYRHKILMY